MASRDRDQLRQELLEFDGRSVTILGESEARSSGTSGYFDALLALIDDPEGDISEGATLLIKSAFEAKLDISIEQIHAYVELSQSVTKWAAQLHVCQTIQYLAVPEIHIAKMTDWLAPLTSDERPFLRAWALDAFAHIVAGKGEYASILARRLASGLDDPAASVRARARKIERRLARY